MGLVGHRRLETCYSPTCRKCPKTLDGGIGLYVRIRNFCALAISPYYRFINAYQSYFGLQDQIHGYYGWQKNEIFNHQVGIRLAAVFY